MIDVHVGNGIRRTSLCAGGVSAAKVTFDHFAGVLVIVDGTEGTSDRADFATDTHIVDDIFGAGLWIENNRFYGTGMETPSLRALRARIGRKPALIMKGKDFNSGLSRIKYPFIDKRTGHFTLQTAGTLFGFNL